MANFSLINYVKESYDELVHKVTWPSWKELQSSTLVVGVATVIITVIVWLMDFTFQTIMNQIYDLLR